MNDFGIQLCIMLGVASDEVRELHIHALPDETVVEIMKTLSKTQKSVVVNAIYSYCLVDKGEFESMKRQLYELNN